MITKTNCVVIVFAAIVVIAGCKKNDSPAITVTSPTTAKPTDVGVAARTVVTATIGTAGGKIISADGIMEMIIPAGVLPSATVISIQPIIGKRYKIELEYESVINPSSDSYLFKDRGSYNINLGGGSGSVSDIVNPDANLQKVSGNCTTVNVISHF